jgi:Holliday junction resolvase
MYMESSCNELSEVHKTIRVAIDLAQNKIRILVLFAQKQRGEAELQFRKKRKEGPNLLLE